MDHLMLAKDWKSVGCADALTRTGAQWQYKYNGWRACIRRDGNRLKVFSREGHEIHTMDHILDGMWLPHDSAIDGELYAHGVPLKRHNSLIQKRQPESSRVKFVCFDALTRGEFSERRAWVKERVRFGKASGMAPVMPFEAGTEKKLLRAAIRKGLEGIMIRPEGMEYEGKRSRGLLRVKPGTV